MEGLKKRSYVFGLILLVVGVTLTTLASMKAPDKFKKDEKWMETLAPDSVVGMEYARSSDNSEQSYKMDFVTYDLLKPYGIVSRVYEDRDRRFDVVLIASKSKASFHDPRICFTGQGWTIVTQEQRFAESKTRGRIPVSVVVMTGKTESDRNKTAAYFYQGPNGYVAGTNEVKWAIFVAEFMGRENLDGVFYRVIPLFDASPEDVLAFIGEYIDAANASSRGYF